MATAGVDDLLPVLLDSWERNNRIVVSLLRAVPEGGFEARAMPGSKSVMEMFTHMLYVRLIFIEEDAPDLAVEPEPRKWLRETDPALITAGLESSGRKVRDVVEDRVRSGRAMQRHYDHPLLFLQHMIWHEGYHHGQIKLALKMSGYELDDEALGPLTWGVWMKKTVGE